jgi:hypothetical protein
MYQVMMQQITNDRINNARQQAEAHRQALQARAARQAETAGSVDEAMLRQDPGIASRLLAAVKQVKVRLTFSPGNVS